MLTNTIRRLNARLQGAYGEVLLLRTDRLLLRDLRNTDAPSLLEFYSDPEVLTYELRTRPYAEQEVRQQLCSIWLAAQQQPRLDYSLAIVLRAEQRLIGDCTIAIPPYDPSTAYLGFRIHRAFWGQGYATEATREVIRFGFTRLQCETIAAGCHPKNHASQRVLEKLGLSYQRELDWDPGNPQGSRSLYFSLDRGTWEAQTAIR